MPTTRPGSSISMPRTCTGLLTSTRSNVFNRPHLPNSTAIAACPSSHTRPPSVHVPAILFVVCPEFPPQSWLFIKDHEQMHGEGNRYDGSNRYWVSVSEHNPQPDPPGCEALVHGV